MSQTEKKGKASFAVLCVGLVASLAFFGVPAPYPAAILAVSAVLFLIVCAAAWSAGGNSLASTDEDRRSLALAGLLLIAPFATFAWLPGYGPPPFATDAQNEVRYLVLLLDSILVATGFVVLARSSLSAANERCWSSVGFACALIAAPSYAVFCAAASTKYLYKAKGTFVESSSDLVRGLAGINLYFGACLCYVATLFFALSLARVGWIRRASAVAFIAVSLVALLTLVAWKVTSPGWVETPLFVPTIPALPWIMPALMGLALLRRSGHPLNDKSLGASGP